MNDSNIFGGSWLFAFLIIALLFGGGNGFGWGNNGPGVDAAINAAVNNQSVQNGIRDVLLSSGNNNYETLQAINGQTLSLMAANNTNTINAIQGFNEVQRTIQAQGRRYPGCHLQARVSDGQLLLRHQDSASAGQVR